MVAEPQPYRTPEETNVPDMPGVSIGHWTDLEARTGCTVVLFDRPVLAAVDVRGGAPATRETDLLAPGRLVRRVDAILLTGGSAFGLAAATGVVEVLAAGGRGFPTAAGPVPIVPAAALYDLGFGHPRAPGHAEGIAACHAAGPFSKTLRGAVGAGTGATIGKIRGADRFRQAGVGLGYSSWSGGSVAALVAVNAFGDLAPSFEADGRGPTREVMSDPREDVLASDDHPTPKTGTATTLGIVLVDTPCRHEDLVRCAVSAHDGFARSIVPCHTPFDGDLVFAVGLTEGDASPVDQFRLCIAAELATERAISDAVVTHGTAP